MAYYERESQETLYSYTPIGECWLVYSTYPPHVRRLLDYATVSRIDHDTDGKVIAVTGTVDANQIRLFKPRN